MANITWDTSDFDRGVGELGKSVDEKVKKAVNNVATEILHLSQFEVPHDTGNLQNSGHVSDGGDDYEKLVGYNTVYAAYQHEGHRADGSYPISNYQDGRKGKYLEDPIRNNMNTFKEYFSGIFNQ